MSAENQQPFSDRQYFKRLALMLGAGILVAGFLTWFMYVLIEFTDQQIDDTARVHILDFVRLQRDERSDQRDRRTERPEPREAPPTPSPDVVDSLSDISPIAVSHIPVDTGLGVDLGGIGSGFGEGEYLPIVRVAPVYPASAAHRGIEGECLVEFTVTATGSTRDISVVEGRCSHSVFRRPSVEAAARFKYRPRIIDGQAVEVHGVRNLFIYNLENATE